MTEASELARQLQAKRTGPAAWTARCPAHNDKHPSLSISEGEDGRLLLNCFAGCEFADILKAAGVEPTKANGKDHDLKPRIIATYDYRDMYGDLVFQVVRLAPKDFRQRRPEGKGGWLWNLQSVEIAPYNLPAVLNANEIYICEGEKDCDALAKLGLVATTNPAGAGKWPKAFSGWFEGRHVTILPDADEPGRKHAHDVASKLQATAASIKIIELPGLPEKGDVSDWIAAGGTADELRRLADAAPYWDESQEAESAADCYPFTLLRDLKPRLDRRELIKGCIPAGGLGVAYAEPGAGKTAVIIDMALHVADDRPYRGRRVEQQPVIYIALEGHGGIGNRILAAAAEIGVDDVLFALITATDNFRDPATSRRVAAVARKLGGSPLVILDTYTAALAGGSDCDPSDVGALIEAVKAELIMKGCTILLIHHCGKDMARGARGWSGLLAACDFEFEMSRDDDRRFLHISKLRDGSDSQGAFCYRLVGRELGVDQYGDSVTAVVVEHLADESESAKGRKKRISPKARSAFNVLWTMIKDPSQSHPLVEEPGLKCVLMNEWETECIKLGVICNHQRERDRRRQFESAKSELLASTLITVDNQRVWPTPATKREESPW